MMRHDTGRFYRHIEACNPPVSETFLPWRIGDQLVGWVRPSFVTQLVAVSDRFALVDDVLVMEGRAPDFASRSAVLADAARALAARGITTPFENEPYAVTDIDRAAALCVVDRAAAAHFGVRSFGQHLNGFVRRPDGIHLWIARRAHDRYLFPGALDNMVAGGLPYGSGLLDNLVKECAEEAAVPEWLARKAVPVGAISYNRVTERGFRRDVLYCYDLELPADFEPRNTDGEVESFTLLHVEEVAKIVRDSDEFKLNCNLVIIDFLLRHGWFAPDSEEYLALALGLRQPLKPAMPMPAEDP